MSESAVAPQHPSETTVPWRSVTVVVPTYQEAENIPHLVERLRGIRERQKLDLELFVMDDDSRDGTAECIETLGLDWVHLFVRTEDRSLSQAVLDGLRRSRREVVVVMDADLSHPPEKIPEMLDALEAGADAVIGSRFVGGGSMDREWGVFRWLNSRVATILAMGLTRLKDPMSGFFAMRRSTFETGRAFNPVGYKIALELLIKCHCAKVVEIPIHFTNRRHGESKLSLDEQLKYLQHLRRLYIHKYGTWSHLAQFLAVGFSGLLVNLGVLTVLLTLRLGGPHIIAIAIASSMVWNFCLNRRFSFSYARSASIVVQFIGYVGACSLGALVNYAITASLWETFATKQAAAVAGVLAGTAFNFVSSRFVVFRAKHVKASGARTGDMRG